MLFEILTEVKERINPDHLYQKFILSGVLIGLGKTPQEAIDKVDQWKKLVNINY